MHPRKIVIRFVYDIRMKLYRSSLHERNNRIESFSFQKFHKHIFIYKRMKEDIAMKNS